MSTRGVIYYNTGTSCAVRLLVSIASLREHYQGSVTILSEGDESHGLCRRIAQATGAEWKAWDCRVTPGANRAYLAKTRYHVGTPYDTTLALDSDTLVTGPVDEVFEWTEQNTFCVAQLANWRTDGGIISRRIMEWEHLLPEAVSAALAFGPAINCGVVAFTKDAPLCRDWYQHAVLGRTFFIPDEVCCQLMLPRYQHRILDGRWNRSCKHDNPSLPDTRIIHYHGRKHCRIGLPFAGERWVKTFERVSGLNLAGVNDWLPAGDRMLRCYLNHTKPPARCPGISVSDPNRERLRPAIAEAKEIKLIVGARTTKYPGWISTNRDVLDVTRRENWMLTLGSHRVRALLAEHVWEHLDSDDMDVANRLAFEFLEHGGHFRIAVPDGFHPSAEYIEHVRPGGTGRSADEHRQLFNYQTLSAAATKAGFKVELLEYWDEAGRFHYQPWQSKDGHVKRSLLHDRRNRHGCIGYTSLIIDAIKPAINPTPPHHARD